MMDILLRDARLAVRRLAKSPGFTITCLLTLALGIGANSAIFSVVHGVLLQRLPFHEPDRLVTVYGTHSQSPRSSLSAPDYLALREDGSAFDGLAAASGWAMQLAGEAGPELLEGGSVSGNFFAVLGVDAVLGRTFDPEVTAEAELDTVVLGHGFWQRHYGGDEAAVGSILRLDGEPYQVIGVLPADFRILRKEASFWVRGKGDVPRYSSPQTAGTIAENRHLRYIRAIGRLAPESTVEQAQAQLDLLMDRYAESFPETNTGRGAAAVPLLETFVGDVRPALLLLAGAVAFVLLIACTNIANLLLARSAARRRELTIRTSLGASRGSLVRQSLVECLLLAVAGGLVGLPLGLASVDLLLKLSPTALPRVESISLSPPVVAFSFGVSLLVGLLFGLLPTLDLRRKAAAAGLRGLLSESDSRGGGGRGQQRSRALLVVAEVALALVLLVGAGLLLRSFLVLRSVETGFEPRGVTALGIVLPQTRYDEDPKIFQFHQQVLERLGALPGVEAVGLAVTPPFTGYSMHVDLRLEGLPEPAAGEARRARYEVMGGEYFRTLGIPLLEGRGPQASDTAEGQPVAWISRSLADRYWPAGDAVGRRLTFANAGGNDQVWRTVVGVVGDVRHALDSPVKDEVYVPYQQDAPLYVNLMVRTSGEPAALAPRLREQIFAVDKEQPIFLVATLEELMARSVAEQRFLLTLLAAFAVVALAMAALGIYGVMAYSVAQRTREIGIRMAVGARRSQVLGQIVRQGMVLAAIGLAVGLGLTFLLRKTLAGHLFGIGSTDPATLAAGLALLLCVALGACYLPARRAATVDPTVSLRGS